MDSTGDDEREQCITVLQTSNKLPVCDSQFTALEERVSIRFESKSVFTAKQNVLFLYNGTRITLTEKEV